MGKWRGLIFGGDIHHLHILRDFTRVRINEADSVVGGHVFRHFGGQL